ncbi:MAG TPA: hypothetical protein VHB23_01575 [Devosiaceae bacterium]|jgi:hypothetical protein|nr:hypothetical protein [Devosiaceae bacterium]
MSKASALARVIGLTRSRSASFFEQGAAARTTPDKQAEPAAVTTEADAAGEPSETAEKTSVTIAEKTNVTALQPAGAIMQVTLVSAEDKAEAADDEDEAARDAVTSEAIEAIEADIARLLSTMGDEDAAEADDSAEDEEGEPVGALLLELNRLWQSDPEVMASRH